MIPLLAELTPPSEEKAKGKKQKAKGKSFGSLRQVLPLTRRLLPFAFCFLPFAFLILSCSAKPPPVKVEQTPYISFANYRTYAWLPNTGGPDKDLFGERASNEVDVQMAGKGYIITLDGPSVLVQIEVVVEERNADKITDYTHYEAAGGTKNLYSAFALGYEEAVLTVSVYDTATRQRVWRGATPVAMDAKHRLDRVAAGIVEMFKSFPPVGGVIPQ